MKYLGFILFAIIGIGLAACQPSTPDTEVKIDFFRSKDGVTSVEKGSSITLSWKALNANECSIQAISDDEKAQSVACEDEGTYAPEATTMYRFSAMKKDAEAVTKDLTITVTNPDPDAVRIEYFRIEGGNAQITLGESVTLAWNAPNATDCQIEASPSPEESDGPQGVDCEDDATFTPDTTTTYRFSASKDGGDAVTRDLTVNVSSSEPAESVILLFTALDAQDYVLESVEGEEGVGEVGAKDPVLTLSVGRRYRIINRVKDSHPIEFVARGGAPVEDTVLFSQLDGVGNDTFMNDPEVNFTKREDGFSFTLTRELAGELDGYRCAYHPLNMRANVETRP